MKYPINDAGVELLKASEDFVGVAYPDPVSPLGKALQKAGLWRQTLRGVPVPDKFIALSGLPWTIGYGFTQGVNERDSMTLPQANTRLARELIPYRDAVRDACTKPLNENQEAALTVCAWNIGKAAIGTSSMVKAHNRGDCAAAARAFALWNKAGGKVVQALVTRRAAEAALYLTPVAGEMTEDDEVEPAPMPQTVEKETSLFRSPIIQGAGGTGITALAALNDTAEKASAANSAVTTLGSILGPIAPYWPYIAMVAVVIVVGAVIWHRVAQRRGGWA